ncbi:MAG: MAPEG family protein [Gammaproteobacteria bacterium]|nr:MAPEG family protein [Gammaproteobacteria bacterium]MCP4880974.1 MAPEG family protein [Gammaproteobacteria bacterium]
MSTEHYYLTWAILLHAFMWVPYILDRAMTRGIIAALSYPVNPTAQSAWATRLILAHANSTENLVAFAAAVLLASAAGIENALIATASMVYFWARVVHVVAYLFAIPFVRTGAFLVGFMATATIAVVCLLGG